MNTKFITNQNGQTLYDRFTALIKNTQYFDVLVGYFYLSGFYKLRQSLEPTEKIRVLVGLQADSQLVNLNNLAQRDLDLVSSSEAISVIPALIKQDLENSEDNYDTYSSAVTFIEWVKQGKIEIRLYKKHKIHSKIYIMSFPESNPDKGRVITGSSNFTQSGLEGNIEYNVELRDDDDYKFAKAEFERLWAESFPLEEQFIETVNTETWVSDSITPYHIYLKFLYEHFKDDLELGEKTKDGVFKPDWHKDLMYQKQAVLSAKKILESYGGVFIADVVGLGKTIMGALLLQEYPRDKSLIITPPQLMDEWENVNIDYRLGARVVSVGKIDKLNQMVNLDDYNNIIIDEAHRFRNEATYNYVKLAEVCRGKRVILLSATPYNNNPKDLLSLVKLFQSGRDSNLPNLRNVEFFLNQCDSEIKDLKKQLTATTISEYQYYEQINKIAVDIRERLLRYVMIRRTRDEIIKYFKQDLSGANFPVLNKPFEQYYQLNAKESIVFTNTLQYIKKLTYARYKTIEYLIKKPSNDKLTLINNLAGFMKTLLVKRLESSKAAFLSTIDYFIESHEKTIDIYHKRGEIYISKKFGINKIAELLDEIEQHENYEISRISQLIEDEAIDKYLKEDMEDQFIKNVDADLQLLYCIRQEWSKVTRDIKFDTFLKDLSQIVNEHIRVIIFTEASDTAIFLAEQLQSKYKVLCVTGSNANQLRTKVLANFSTNFPHQENDYNVLITTDVLSEGVSLQRANVIVNYDIPWNPTRMMQRIGRINRVDSEFPELFVYNFFPTNESNEVINLTANAKTKISMFIELLGTDSHTLTGEEIIGGKELFDRLSNISDDDTNVESELEYLSEIKTVRDEAPDLFAKIKKLPKKCKTQRKLGLVQSPELLSYFRQGQLEKYIKTNANNSNELNFIDTAKLMRTNPDEPSIRGAIDETYFELLLSNKNSYERLIQETSFDGKIRGGKDAVSKLINILKACIKDTKQFTENQELYYLQFKKNLESGNIPKALAKKISNDIEYLIKNNKIAAPLATLDIIVKNLPKSLIKEHRSRVDSFKNYKQEVILSEYFV